MKEDRAAEKREMGRRPRLGKGDEGWQVGDLEGYKRRVKRKGEGYRVKKQSKEVNK